MTKSATKTRKRRVLPALLILIAVAIIAAFTLSSSRKIELNEYVTAFSNLPDGFDGYRIAQLSDIHGRDKNDYIELVKSSNPDIIVITGDLIDDKTDMSFAQPLLSELVKIAPVYYVTGNHEYDGADLSGLIDIMEECGVTFLRNSYVELYSDGDSIVLAGTDDPNGRADMETPAELFDEINEEYGDCFTVVLNHRNTKLDEFAELGADLVLAGHAHGGVLGIIGPGMQLFPENTSGICTKGDTTMVVSRGLSNLRFLNSPEVALIKLVKE